MLEAKLVHCLLACCSACLLTASRITSIGWYRPTVSWALPQENAPRAFPQPLWWRNFLNWGASSNMTPVCIQLIWNLPVQVSTNTPPTHKRHPVPWSSKCAVLLLGCKPQTLTPATSDLPALLHPTQHSSLPRPGSIPRSPWQARSLSWA